jgi:branched-chain amino acid transport system ATP-binding protein
MLLEVKNLAVGYGAIRAVKDVSLNVDTGEIVALIGANGAGKTTTVKAIAGLLPYTGEILFSDLVLPHGAAESVVRSGLALVPEGRGILSRMSVEENLLMGTYLRRDRAKAKSDIEEAMDRFPILRLRRASLAGLLSGGEQQMLAIARALLSRPRLLILDEPSLGLAPLMIERIFQLVEELRKGGLSILLVEQKARQTLKVADRAYVLETGLVFASGTTAELASGSIITQAFLGGGAGAQVAV